MMQLADAIEQWGLAHRDRLDSADTDTLRTVWSTLRRSASAQIAVDSMSAEDSRAVMELFTKSHRKHVAVLLNEVARWSASPDDSARMVDRVAERRARVSSRQRSNSAGVKVASTAAGNHQPTPEVDPATAETKTGLLVDRADAVADSGDSETKTGLLIDRADGDADSGDSETKTGLLVDRADGDADWREPDAKSGLLVDRAYGDGDISESDPAYGALATESDHHDAGDHDAGGVPDAAIGDLGGWIHDNNWLDDGPVSDLLHAGQVDDAATSTAAASQKSTVGWYFTVVLALLTIISVGVLVYFLFLA